MNNSDLTENGLTSGAPMSFIHQVVPRKVTFSLDEEPTRAYESKAGERRIKADGIFSPTCLPERNGILEFRVRLITHRSQIGCMAKPTAAPMTSGSLKIHLSMPMSNSPMTAVNKDE